MTATPESVAVVPIDGQEVTARITTNGLCAVEESFGGQSLEDIGAQMSNGHASFSVVRAIFRAVLLPERPDLSAVGAGLLINKIGTEETARVIQVSFDRWKSGALGVKSEIPEATQKGEVIFEAGGVRYVLAFAFNAMAEIEPVFPGLSMPQIAAALMEGGVSVSRMRAMFRAALIDHQETSLFEAGEIMDRIGLSTVSDAVGKAFIAAFPKVPENEGDQVEEVEPNRQKRRAAAKGKPANPTKPQRPKGGTGARSKRSGPAKG